MKAALALLVLSLSPAIAAAQTCTCSAETVESDRVRIREHLRRVEAELRAVSTDHLTTAQREARARNLDRLHDYMLRGEFPHGSPDQPSPISPTFVDADGRACAMAHLVIESGAREVAEEIARTELHAYVPSITHPALGPWIEANGMTLAEATLVQPGYAACPCPPDAEAYVCWARYAGDGTTINRCGPSLVLCPSWVYPATAAEDGGWYCQPDASSPFWPDLDADLDASLVDAGFDAGRWAGLDAGRFPGLDVPATDAGRRDGGARDGGCRWTAAARPPPTPAGATRPGRARSSRRWRSSSR